MPTGTVGPGRQLGGILPATYKLVDIDSSNDTLDIRFGKHRLALRNFVADISSSTDDREFIVSGVAQWNIIFVC